jgi:putative peptide zinc metalloprotease protein
MSSSIFSSSWYRVAELKPLLRSHSRIHRHEYLGEIWYVLQDPLSGRFYRFSPSAYQLIGLLDGKRSMHEIWELAAERLGDDAPGQEEVIRLLSQLHSADVLQCDVPPDSLELFKRHQRQERMRWKQRFWSPLALRFPLFDPERFLTVCLPLVRPLFSWFGFLLWLGLIVTGGVVTAMHWPELTENFVDRVLAPQNLLLLWITYPLVKAFHELGHAFATKVWGGEVHEIGVMLLVFMPVPYVDASAASAFREKRKRMVVGAMGIMTELLLAALALFVWLSAEHGMVRGIAYNVMLIGGVSTLFFNGNPLLRFDGYYVLADALEMPNLGKRSNSYLGYLIQRYLFGSESASSPANAGSERKWLLFYSIASFCYRLFVMFAIVLFVAGKFFIIGILLASWSVFMMLVLPIFKMIKFVLSGPQIERQRLRAVSITVGGIAAIVVALTLLPAPLWTRAEGVVWLPEQAIIRAGTDCFVNNYVSEPDSEVEVNQVLVRCEDPLLHARARQLRARTVELNALHASQRRSDRVAARITEEELRVINADLANLEERIEEFDIRSPLAGKFIVPRSRDLPGNFINQGDIIGYLITPRAKSVHMAIPQDDVGMLRTHIESIQVRLADRLDEVFPATIVRQVPGGTNQLPSAALGSEGGGVLAIDPRDSSGTRTLETVFVYELELPPGTVAAPIGMRVYVRIDHGSEVLARQWYRRLRQVFLRTLNV